MGDGMNNQEKLKFKAFEGQFEELVKVVSGLVKRVADLEKVKAKPKSSKKDD